MFEEKDLQNDGICDLLLDAQKTIHQFIVFLKENPQPTTKEEFLKYLKPQKTLDKIIKKLEDNKVIL